MDTANRQIRGVYDCFAVRDIPQSIRLFCKNVNYLFLMALTVCIIQFVSAYVNRGGGTV